MDNLELEELPLATNSIHKREKPSVKDMSVQHGNAEEDTSREAGTDSGTALLPPLDRVSEMV